MALDAKQVDCKGCGAKVDIHAGIRSKTFVCEYCGSVCEGEAVVAVQEMAARKTKYKPWSHIRLGMNANLLGQEYQVIGRIRCEERYWWWDEWFLYSQSGFPLWLQEGEGGFTIFRVFYPTYPVDPREVGSFVKLDNKGGHAQVRERGHAKIAFIEGELTWSAKPGEEFDYIECYRKNTRYSIEYSDEEIQYIRGEARDPAWVYGQFQIQEAPPAPLEFEDPDEDDDWDDDDDDDDEFVWSQPTSASQSEGWSGSTKAIMGLTFVLGLGLLALSCFGAKQQKHFQSYTFKVRAATGKDDGVLLRDKNGKAIKLKLPKSSGAYELRMASSGLGHAGVSGGQCWWAQVDFLKEKSQKALKKIEAELKEDGEKMDQWARYKVVHRVAAWFGKYWGYDEGNWVETEYVRNHYFNTDKRGPYFIRVYANNCKDYRSRKFNPVSQASLTLGFYKDVWMTRWIFWAGIILVGFVIIAVFWHVIE